MHLLEYTNYRPDGIFGRYTFDGDDNPMFVTLSHSYQQQDGSYLPIVMPGIYTAVRGVHALANGIQFKTFEVIGISGHSGLLFVHPGCFQKDSHGCTLCGEKVIQYDSNRDGKITSVDDEMITNSRAIFAKWMARMGDTQTFQLEVKNA
jgi:hypothetical protein